MLRARTLPCLLTLGLSLGTAFAAMTVEHGDAIAKKKKKVKKPKKDGGISAAQKQARADLMGPFTWGMSKDEVLAARSKQLDESYAEKIAGTTDESQQGRLRKEQATEIKGVERSWEAFEEGKKSGWDVSLIEGEFARGVDEAMLYFWERSNGTNQARYFFFDDGALYKMFISLDIAQLDAESFGAQVKTKLGDGAVGDLAIQPGEQIWVRALDKLKDYGALCLVIAEPARLEAVYADRKARVK